MAWFSPKALIDPDEFDWLLACWRWLDTEEAAAGRPSEPPLFLPTAQYFPGTSLQGEELARHVFDTVRSLAGMSDWACALHPLPERRDAMPEALGFVQQRSDALGTFRQSRDRNHATITYRPDLLADPAQLVATFAHELAHYRMHSYRSLPPGGAELEELATDLLAIRMGFGILLANSAKTFSAYSSHDRQGWRSQRSGYLSEQAIVTALALGERLAGRDPRVTAGPHLKNYLRSDLKRADRHLTRAYRDLRSAVATADQGAFA